MVLDQRKFVCKIITCYFLLLTFTVHDFFPALALCSIFYYKKI